MTKHIPNLFTLINLIFGCLAIVVIMQNGIIIQYAPDGTQYINTPEKIWMASLFIAIAALVDFLDGFVARWFKASSEMGKQLDSLADLVSFGVAPAMILYQFLRLSIAQEDDGMNASIIWLVPAFILAAAGAWRLARFNLDTSQSFGFKGVPIPAAGLMVASLPLIYWNNYSQLLVDVLLNKWFLYALIILLSWLMVSRIPMLAMKFKDYSIKNNMPKIILLAVTIVAALFFQWLAVPIVFIVYIILSLLFKQQQS